MIGMGIRIAILATFALIIGGVCRLAWAQEIIDVPVADAFDIVSANSYQVILGTAGYTAVVVHFSMDYEEAPSIDLNIWSAYHLTGGEGVESAPIYSSPPSIFNGGYTNQGIVVMLVPGAMVYPSVEATVNPGYRYAGDLPQSSILIGTQSVDDGIVNALRQVSASPSFVNNSLLTNEGLLTDTGAAYLIAAMPYARVIVPGLFAASHRDIVYSRVPVGGAYADELATADGSAQWQSQFDVLADFIGQPLIMVKTLIVVILGAIAAWWSQKQADSPLITLPVMGLALGGGALVGWVSLAFIGILGFAGLFVFVFVTVLKRAN